MNILIMMLSLLVSVSGWAKPQEGCFKLDVTINGTAFVDYFNIESHDIPAMNSGEINTQFYATNVFRVQGKGRVSYSFWGDLYFYTVPFVASENGKEFKFTLRGESEGVQQLRPFGENDMVGHLAFEDGGRHPFTAVKIGSPTPACGVGFVRRY